MKKLIVNADDFGFKEGINKGIIFAHQNGVVTSASLFVDGEASQDAVNLARENPSLGLGPHLDLDKFFIIDQSSGVVVDWVHPKPDIDEVKSEIKRQMGKYFSYGLHADHADSHHHVHLNIEVFPVFCEILKEYKIPIFRFAAAHLNDFSKCEDLKKMGLDSGFIFADHFIEGWYWGNVDEPYEIAELVTHPGYGELWREAELANCCHPEMKKYLIDQKIDLLRFSDAIAK